VPLQELVPKIDNRRYQDIVAEARTRIPRYTPEWTDLNENDPGIALVELLAWMSDLLLYRLGKVPELNYLKFLELIGIELLPAEPASAEVTFPVLPGTTEPFVIVPMNTPVSAEAPGDDRPIVFETERSLIALTAALASVQVFDGYAFTDVTLANTEAEDPYPPFGPAAADGAALLLGFEYNAPFPEVRLDLAVFFAAPRTPSTAVECGPAQVPLMNTAEVVWEYWSGSDWRPLSLLKDETRTFLRTGHVLLKTPAKGKMATLSVNGSAALFWIRAVVKRTAWDRAPRILAVRTNTVAVQQAETARDEVLGGTDGEPNQVHRLANMPVLPGTLVLEVDEGDGFVEWSRVDDLYGSGPDDRHYVLNRTTGEVRFGNGTRGAIPVANPENPAGNVVARRYRFGGGLRGNVAAGAIKTMDISVPGIAEDQVGNLLPAAGGRDEETLQAAKERAPATLKANNRAVTAEDFEELARRVGTVKRARALPLHHPQFPDVSVPGVVSVIVIPENDEPNPMPSEGTIRSVCALLNRSRLLTTEVYVIPPTYHEVSVTAELVASPTADLGIVKEAVHEALITYFHPLRGGDNGLGWPFGGDIFFSRVYQRMQDVAGVERIERVIITLDGESAEECKDVPIPDGALLFSTTHDVEVHYAFEE
jgi:predicted phage baseplate assembly protein